jgi:hypothetical protein
MLCFLLHIGEVVGVVVDVLLVSVVFVLLVVVKSTRWLVVGRPRDAGNSGWSVGFDQGVALSH